MSAEQIEVVAGIIRKNQNILVARRPRDTHLAGYWEFPGGKPEDGESDAEALKRELREELGMDASVVDHYHSVTHDYEEKTIELRFYTCVPGDDATPKPLECEDVRWVQTADLRELSFPPADKELITKLQNESSKQT